MSDKELRVTESRARDCLGELIGKVTSKEFSIFNWKLEVNNALREMFGDQLDEWEDVTDTCHLQTEGDVLEMRSYMGKLGGSRIGKIQNGEVILHSDIKIENGRIWRKK
jgi:hypothetical protein